jgi:hypothetical protein
MKNQKKTPAPATSGRLQIKLPRRLYVAASESAKITGKSIEEYVKNLLVADATKTIPVAITPEQLHHLLTTLESAMIDGLRLPKTRGLALLDELEAAPPHFNSYDIAMIGPLYRQLVGHWDGTETPASEVDGDKIERFAGRACFAAG